MQNDQMGSDYEKGHIYPNNNLAVYRSHKTLTTEVNWLQKIKYCARFNSCKLRHSGHVFIKTGEFRRK